MFAAATPPSCDDEDGARTDGYEITSEGPDVLMWCLGRDGQGRYLHVVNNRRYPVVAERLDALGRDAKPIAEADVVPIAKSTRARKRPGRQSA